MDSSHPVGGGPDHSFAFQQGGHTGIPPSNDTYTQSFIWQNYRSISIAAGTASSVLPLDVQLTDLGTRLNCANLWQTYKINSVEVIVSQPLYSLGEIVPYTFNIAPYSRDPSSGALTTQAIDPQSLPGCQTRIVYPATYYLLNSQTQVFQNTGGGFFNMLKCANPNPMYAIDARNQAAIGGRMYGNGALTLQGIDGTDTTRWYAFLFSVKFYSNRGTLISFTVPVIYNASITFEGPRWLQTVLYPPGESYILGSDDDAASDDSGPIPPLVRRDKRAQVSLGISPGLSRDHYAKTTSSSAPEVRMQCDSRQTTPEGTGAGVGKTHQAESGDYVHVEGRGDGVQGLYSWERPASAPTGRPGDPAKKRALEYEPTYTREDISRCTPT